MDSKSLKPAWRALHSAGHRMSGDPDYWMKEWIYALDGGSPDAQGIAVDVLEDATLKWIATFAAWARQNTREARKRFPLGAPWPEPFAIAELIPERYHRDPPADPWSWWPPTGSRSSALGWSVIARQEQLRADHAGCYVAPPERRSERRWVREARWDPAWPESPHIPERDRAPESCGLWCAGSGRPAVDTATWLERWKIASQGREE